MILQSEAWSNFIHFVAILTYYELLSYPFGYIFFLRPAEKKNEEINLNMRIMNNLIATRLSLSLPLFYCALLYSNRFNSVHTLILVNGSFLLVFCRSLFHSCPSLSQSPGLWQLKKFKPWPDQFSFRICSDNNVFPSSRCFSFSFSYERIFSKELQPFCITTKLKLVKTIKMHRIISWKRNKKKKGNEIDTENETDNAEICIWMMQFRCLNAFLFIIFVSFSLVNCSLAFLTFCAILNPIFENTFSFRIDKQYM